MITILLITLFLLIFPQNAHAYLDPGIGSYILQLALGFVIGGLYSLKRYWKRIKTYFQDQAPEKKDHH